MFIGFAGLAVNAAFLWTARLRMQSAADAGALAAADALLAGNATATMAAQAAASSNGFIDGQGTSGNPNLVTVAVNTPPTTGAYSSTTGAVEVLVSQLQPTFFLKVLPQFASIPVSAQAVASPSPAGCIYSLDPSSGQALLVNGGSLTSNCGLLVNSNSSSALSVNSGASLTVSGGIGVVGGTLISGSVSPQPVTGIISFSDPFASMPTPAPPAAPSNACSSGTNLTVNGGGTYEEPNGCYTTVNINSRFAVVNFHDGGNYVFPNGLTSTAGTVDVDGSGSYYFGGPINLTSGTFNAGGSGTYYYTGVINANGGVTANLMPGYYGGGINVSGADATINLIGSGLYVFGASVIDNTTGTIQSQTAQGGPTNVTLYFNGGTLIENSSAILNMSAPLSGTYEGILLFQDRANSTAVSIDTGASVTLNGALYLPDATLAINGGFVNDYLLIIAYDITQNSGALTIGNNYSALQDGPPIKQTVLVE